MAAPKKGRKAKASAKKPAGKQAKKPAAKKPPSRKKLAAHGAFRRYQQGCRCQKCKAANAKHSRDLRKRKARKKGPKMTAAQQSVRDTHMLARHFQGWSAEEIGEEFDLSPDAVKKALIKKKAAQEKLLNLDPTVIIERLVQEHQVAIADLEKIAAAAMEVSNLTAAVGAKRSAMDGREKLRELLQSIGALPNDLGTLTHVIDLKAVAEELVAVVDQFSIGVRALKLSKKDEGSVLEVAGEVTAKLKEIGNVSDNQPAEES
jgi:hypothetical protein